MYNALVGKEWKVGRAKLDKIATDIKCTYAGGRAYTPFDLTASNAAGHEVLLDAYSSFYPDYFRLDFKIGYTHNSRTKKISQSFSLDLQNATNNKNVFSQNYDQRNQSINTNYQLGFFPNVVYKIQF